jgi:AraC-like DNA-binding protein
MKAFPTTELNRFGLRAWSGSVQGMPLPHRHNEIELNALESGHLTYVLAGRLLTIRAGEVALFWGALPHQVRDSTPETRLHWVTTPLEEALGWGLPHSFLQALLAGDCFVDAQPLFDVRFFARWNADLTAGQHVSPLMEMRALFFRFAQLPQAAGGEPLSDRVHARANAMARLISRRFAEPLTVAEIATAVNLAPSTAMSMFKAAFGLSLFEYLTQQRIAYAQQRLIMSDDPITEVALAAGFPSLSHFYEAFARLCGAPPGRYRAALRR